MNAVDTNVLLYYVDKDEPAKQAKATALLADLSRRAVPCLLLSQVAVEFAAGLTRWVQKGKVSAAERQTYFQNVTALFPYSLPKTNLVPAAFDLADRHSLSYREHSCWRHAPRPASTRSTLKIFQMAASTTASK